MNEEQLYTSTSNKLLNHLDRLQLIRKDGIWSPISLQIAPTELCNLDCEFCSVKNRGVQTLIWEQLEEAINTFVRLGIKSIEITGGGDPTLYHHINSLIDHCYKHKLEIGLITNGVALDKIEQQNLDKLTWLRISLNGLDYDKIIQVPKIPGTLGFSYVWNSKSTLEILNKIYMLSKEHNVEYVRIVPDCLKPKEQIQLKNQILGLIKYSKYQDTIFVQSKDYKVYPNCWIGALKPFLYADGYVYQCSATALYERKFGERWRICHIDKIKEYYSNPIKPFPNTMCKKGKCFYYDHNKLLDELQMQVKHNGFI